MLTIVSRDGKRSIRRQEGDITFEQRRIQVSVEGQD
jgi:hypothetical protein